MAADTGEDRASGEKVMTLVEHLSELRLRIFIALLAIGIGSVVGFFVAPQVIDLLRAPVGQPLVFTSLGGAFFLQLKIAVIIGLVLVVARGALRAVGVRVARA